MYFHNETPSKWKIELTWHQVEKWTDVKAPCHLGCFRSVRFENAPLYQPWWNSFAVPSRSVRRFEIGSSKPDREENVDVF